MSLCHVILELLLWLALQSRLVRCDVYQTTCGELIPAVLLVKPLSEKDSALLLFGFLRSVGNELLSALLFGRNRAAYRFASIVGRLDGFSLA